jgi:hypothetical protein
MTENQRIALEDTSETIVRALVIAYGNVTQVTVDELGTAMFCQFSVANFGDGASFQEIADALAYEINTSFAKDYEFQFSGDEILRVFNQKMQESYDANLNFPT